jgi:hypothetical protein
MEFINNTCKYLHGNFISKSNPFELSITLELQQLKIPGIAT